MKTHTHTHAGPRKANYQLGPWDRTADAGFCRRSCTNRAGRQNLAGPDYEARVSAIEKLLASQGELSSADIYRRRSSRLATQRALRTVRQSRHGSPRTERLARAAATQEGEQG